MLYNEVDLLSQDPRLEVLDLWREYTLLRLLIHDDPGQAALWLGPRIVNGMEATYLLKMICPSTGLTHVLRVPPSVTSARDAATWINWETDPEHFAVET